MTTALPERRDLSYDFLQDFLNDAEELAASKNYTTIGNWTLAQILWHLNSSMTASLEGFPFMAPWYQRIAGKLFKKKFLGMKLPAGFKLPPNASSMVPSEDVTIEDTLQKVRTAIQRFETETPDKPHPFFGQLKPEEWNSLHCKHAALHMSFVLPK